MTRDDLTRLHHMLDTAREARSYTTGRQRAELHSDRMLLHSLVRCITIIGEAAANVSTECRRQVQAIPWTDVVDVSFPAGARWARVDLPHDEYFAVMAIQAADKGRAVQAMETVRALMREYRPDASAPT